MLRNIRYLRLLIILAALFMIVFVQFRNSFLNKLWSQGLIGEYSRGVYKHELFMTNYAKHELEKPFETISAEIKPYILKDMDESGFTNWAAGNAAQNPLIAAVLIWRRGSGLEAVTPTGRQIDEGVLQIIEEYLDTKFRLERFKRPFPAYPIEKLKYLQKKIQPRYDFSIYRYEFYPEIKSLKASIEATETIFGVVWDIDYYRSQLLPGILPGIEEVINRGFHQAMSTDSGPGPYFGILITDGARDTVYTAGRVQLEPYLSFSFWEYEEPRYYTLLGLQTPSNWTVFVHDHPDLEFNRRMPRVIGIDLPVIDYAGTIRSETVSFAGIVPKRGYVWWIYTALSLGIITFFIFFQVYARRRQRDFIAHVSHELRTPITKIRMFAEILFEDRAVSEAKENEYLGTIIGESDHLAVMIDNTLNLSRLEAGKMAMTRKKLDPIAFLKDFHEKQAAYLRQAGFETRLDISPDVSPISADPEYLELALRNIVENAVKYSHDIKEVEIAALNKSKELVQISVSDRGSGIPERKRKAIFRRFYRIKPTDREAVGGAGIGLSIVKEIIKLHRGKIRVEEREGGGSRFVMELPTVK